MSIARDLAAFCATTGAGPGSDNAQDVMRLSLYDWMVCGLAGVDEPVAKIMRSMEHAGGPAQVFGSPRSCAPAAAAWINGATSHALDYDDTHFAHIGHPSVAVFPAVFALVPQARSGGADIGWAALLGAEVSVRVGQWLGRTHYQSGFHQTATAGAFGAAAAACVTLRLAADQTETAFGLVATQAAGLKSQFGTMGKPYHAGLAARTGVEAALLAQAGFDTRGAGLDGPQGFGDTHHGESNLAAFDDLGRQWRMETVSHKFHACCHGLHAMLEASATLTADPLNISQIRIWTHPRWLSVCNLKNPATGLECKFSFCHTVAMALLGQSTAALDSYTDDNAVNPELCAMREKVHVIEDETLAETASRVEFCLSDGTKLVSEYDLDQPVAHSAKAAKLRGKGRALLTEATEARLWKATHANKAPDPDALSGLMKG